MDEDLVASLAPDVDSDVLGFLRGNVDSFVKWDLIQFFDGHPDSVETAEHLATFTGRDVEATQAGLSELAGQRVLVPRQAGRSIAYSLADDPATRDLVHRFVRASADRGFRVRAIYHVIRSMQ